MAQVKDDKWAGDTDVPLNHTSDDFFILFFHVFFYNELKGKNELLAKHTGGED